jgi:hypothetical protein
MPTNERFVVLGVAPVRREWFRRVGRWANEATLPVEFVKCVAIGEVISRLESGRPFSALLVDASAAGLDRDVIDLANAVGCSPIIVDHGLVDRDWRELGARAVIPERFDAGDLGAILEEHSQPIGRSIGVTEMSAGKPDVEIRYGQIVAVTGAGGLGVSTVAMALAQGLAQNDRRRPLLLADMALRASQAMFHDARDVVPGLTELIESHRLGVPNFVEATSSIHSFPERGYDLLLGLRHERDWVSIAARALAASWTTLTTRYDTTVCDITGEFDGADETGSNDIEDRNRLARMAAQRADLVLVVGTPGAWGIHHLVRTILSLSDLGVPSNRILPVVNHAPRQPRSRSQITSAVADLLGSRIVNAEHVPSPVFLPTRRNLESTLRDGDPIPSSITARLAAAVDALLSKTEPAQGPDHDGDPIPVAPGSLGTWSDDR